MPRLTLELVAAPLEDGTTLLCSPGPGKLRWLRPPGEALVPGSQAGILTRDGLVYELLVPAGVFGAIREIRQSHRWNECGHGEPLAVLDPSLGAAPGAAAEGPAANSEGGLFELRSPTHGTFYLRPTPGSPPFAPAGTTLSAGDTVGLIEVMKCFSPILFQPPGTSQSGVVREVLAAEGKEVQVQQVLLRIELD